MQEKLYHVGLSFIICKMGGDFYIIAACISPVKRDQDLEVIHATRMNLETTVLSERSQRQRAPYYMILFV